MSGYQLFQMLNKPHYCLSAVNVDFKTIAQRLSTNDEYRAQHSSPRILTENSLKATLVYTSNATRYGTAITIDIDFSRRSIDTYSYYGVAPRGGATIN